MMKKDRRGMTLLEVVIASVLLSWLIAGMFAIYNGTQKIMARTNRIQYAALLGRERLEQMAGYGFDGHTNYPTSDAGAVFDPNSTSVQHIITEQGNVLSASLGSDANDFIRRHLERRETTITNHNDWTGSGVDYRQIEVSVVWDEEVQRL